jgi:hypothetical protein
MINENELIEGCNVQFKEKLFSVKWKQVNKVIIRPVDDIGFIETTYENIEPVTVTPEILKNIGFTETADSLFEYSDKEKWAYKVDLSNPEQLRLIIKGEESVVDKMHLHQLQKKIFEDSKELVVLKSST